MLLSICLIFCQFQPGVVYKSVTYKKSVYFESQKYYAVEIVEEMRLVIYDKDQLKRRKNWYLISLKRIFVTGVCYLLIFNLELHIPEKPDFFCAERTSASLTEKYNNMELKTFRKVLFLVSKFFLMVKSLKS